MKKIVLFQFLIFIFSFLNATENDYSTICLNMIVKNEKEVILRCLESVKPLIDYWVIVDTGSNDGTQEIIKEYMKDIPGELHERPWIHFEYNRNEALQLAIDKADYLFFIDADDILSIDPSFKKQKLSLDSYLVSIKYNGLSYDRIQLIKSDFPWRWDGPVHEVLVSDYLINPGHLDHVKIIIVGGGDRSQDPKKFLKDAELLEEAVRKNPFNTRYVFYLAQSYRDAGEYDLAIQNYEKRIAMGGWDQEVFWSLYQVAIIKEVLNLPEEAVVKGYLKAHQYHPSRIEPLYRISSIYRRAENYLPGYLYSNFALMIDPPMNVLFTESWINDYGLLLEYSICCYWMGRYSEFLDASFKILNKDNIPLHVRECVENNISFIIPRNEINNYLANMQKAG